ncbi:MAG: TolC family protein [bacterium]
MITSASKWKIGSSLLIVGLILIFISSPVQAQLTLQEAYELALENSDQIKISRENIRQSKADQSMVSSGLWPQVNLQASKIRQKEIEATPGGAPGTPEDDYTYGVQLNQYLFQGGKRYFESSAAQWQVEASEAEDYRRRQRVLFSVARNYYEVLLARRKTEIARSVLQRAQNQLQRARGRFEVGEITRTGVLRARVQVAKAEEQLQRAKNSRRIARDQLTLAMGIDKLQEDVKDIEEKEAVDEPVDEYYQLAFNNRRDLQAVQKTEKALAERLKSEQANYSPRVGLEGSYDYQDEGRVGDEEEFWQVMLQASYPLFTGWRETAQINKVRSTFDQATARLEEKRRSVKIDVRSAFLEMQTEEKVISSARDQVEAARKNYEEIVARFEEGLVTSLDVSDAHDALSQAEQSLAASYYQQQLNILRLKLAAGVYKQELLNQ